MFRVLFVGQTLNVKFYKKESSHRDGSRKVITFCFIDAMGTTYTGCAKQSYKDSHVKMIGRKVALAKAIANIKRNLPLSLNTHHPRNVSRAIWAAFHEKYTGVTV